jgi:hypothetical protein
LSALDSGGRRHGGLPHPALTGKEYNPQCLTPCTCKLKQYGLLIEMNLLFSQCVLYLVFRFLTGMFNFSSDSKTPNTKHQTHEVSKLF